MNGKSAALGTLSAVLAIAAVAPQPAQAQPAYGSYVGVGGSFGLSDGPNGDGGGLSAVVAGRYRLLELPVSIRAQAFLLGGSFAVVPTVSYDYDINFQTTAYVGAGLSLAGGDDPSPVGNKTAFVIQPGIDYALPDSNLVIFGNAVFAFDAYDNGGGTATAIQGGVGWNLGR